MSLTVNLPQKTIQELKLKLPLQQPLTAHVNTLLQKIKASIQMLPETNQKEVMQALDDWERVFFDEYADAQNEESAHALLFLRINTIQYVMLNYLENDVEKLKWLKHYNKIEKIVVSILPRHIDITTFIAVHTQKYLEDSLRYRVACVIDEALPRVAADYAGVESRLYEKIDQIIEEMQQEFESTKDSLMLIMQDRTIANGEIHEELQRNTDQIEQMYRAFEKQLHEMQDQGKRLEMKETALAHLLDACEAVIYKV
jgi:hypothetical protein